MGRIHVYFIRWLIRIPGARENVILENICVNLCSFGRCKQMHRRDKIMRFNSRARAGQPSYEITMARDM